MNDLASQVISDLVFKGLQRLYAPISKLIDVQMAKFLADFDNYSKYMVRKCGYIRTLYEKNRPVELEKVYQKVFFKQRTSRVSDKDLMNRFSSGRRIIVKGNGGSGKTIFLKHLWLQRFTKSEGRIPILVELRRLNELSSGSLIQFCRAELQSDLLNSDSIFEKLCHAGKFEFIFDGFDEVVHSKRRATERQIIELSEKFPECPILVSGREDDRFSSWGTFEIYTVAPLEISEVRELIDKVPFDIKVKKKFLGSGCIDFRHGA